jgi:hypothetical protein
MRTLARYLAPVLLAFAGCGAQDARSSSEEASQSHAAYTTMPQTVPTSPGQAATSSPPVSYVSTKISDWGTTKPLIDSKGHLLIGLHGIPADDAAEQTLHQILVSYHANEKVADCIVAEAFKAPSKRLPSPSGDVFLFTAEDFAEYAERCGIEIGDLWTYPGD